jgi:hypothetical protein
MLKDIKGMRFGRLTVLERAENNKHGQARWLCLCDCGSETIVGSGNLSSGNTMSCGCLHREGLITRNTVHGECHSRLYDIWAGMKTRVSNPGRKEFACYGGKGITVCEEWNDYPAFRDWAMANGYRDDLSIDRIDNDGNYEPCNCRWVDMKTQANNTRRNRFLTVGNMTYTIAEWSRKLNVRSGLIIDHLRLGWTPEQALGLV